MALITCPNCGKPVSDRAVTCPHCSCNLKEKGVAGEKKDITPKEDSPTTPIIEQEKSSSNRGMIIIIFLLFAILVAIGGVLGYQKYCDLGYGPYEYEAPADSDVAEPLCCDTTAVDTVEAIDDTQTKLEEFKNFRTNDLSAFMLHGKVKHVEESYGGNAYTLYTFNEQGKLIDVCLSGGTCYEIRHEGNILILLDLSESHSSKTEYEVDSSDRLIRYFYESSYDDSEESKYSQFDDNGWPTFSINISWLEEEKTSSHITYKDIDEYGNWTRKAIDGEDREFRTITYYPID